jgi:hypothetical protein
MGLAWLFRWRRKPAPGAPPGDPAAELKQKLAESRAAEAEREVEPEPTPDATVAPLEERRSAVHGRARAAIERMRGEQQGE